MEDNETVHIAIVGCGPKGLYGFERLAASFKENCSEVPVVIDIYNRSSHFGAGDVYNPEQPPYLLINNPVGDVNMWLEKDPPPVVPNPLSCTEWLQSEGENITGRDYVSRAKVGKYLNHGFQAIADNLPENLSVHTHIGEVTEIRKSGPGYELTFKAENFEKVKSNRYDHILLATGHPKPQLSPQEKNYLKRKSKLEMDSFISFIYPVGENLSGIEPDSTVGLKGLGLTFIDAVLALTEGRNGEFQQVENDKLEYIPSGEEPSAIYPFSRSGLPMIPRNSNFSDTPSKFFSKQNLTTLARNTAHSKIDFFSQLLPLLKQEMKYAFYCVEMNRRNFRADFSTCTSFDEVEDLATQFHDEFPESKPFDVDTFLNPLSDSAIHSPDQLNEFIQNYQSFFLKEASEGEQNSGWAAASAVWRKITPLFNKLYSFGGLTPESHHKFDKSFRTKLNRVTFGPPLQTARKLIALQEAGLLDYGLSIQPDVFINDHNESFTLSCNQTKTSRSVQYLVDARIPKISLTENSSLHRNMYNRHLISLFENRDGNQYYQPGCLDISKDGYAINSDGNIEKGILVTGTPTEGITFDNDTLSRKRNNFVSSWAESINKMCRNRSELHEIT